MIYNDIRLLAVERFKTLDITADPEFQELVQIASNVCDTPIALITLMDEETQWLRVRKGTEVERMPQATSFCAHTLLADEVMVVPDALEDSRFSNNLIVVSDPNVRFYAGAPLTTKEGHRIGTLCVFDVQPHELDKHQRMMLKMLTQQAINLMEFRISLELLAKNKIEVEHQREIIKKGEITQRSFFESSANLHVLLDKNCEVLDFNKVSYDLLKKLLDLEITRNSRFIKFISPDFVRKFNKKFKLALTGKKQFEEGTSDFGNRGIMYWEASFEPARDADNHIIGVSYIVRDVSDRKIKELKIIDQNRSLLKIAHLQAHEFRAPLTSVMGMIDLIRAEENDAPWEYYEQLENAVHNLDSKIKQIVGSVNNMALLDGTEVYAC